MRIPTCSVIEEELAGCRRRFVGDNLRGGRGRSAEISKRRERSASAFGLLLLAAAMEEPEVRRKPKLFRDRSGGDVGEVEGERNLLRKHRGKKIWSTMMKGCRPGSRRSKGEETGLLVQEEEKEEEPDAGKKEKSKDPKKQKKKRKGWKRIRHALLITCRYIGMGVAHMAPTSSYPSDCYYVDPYSWYVPHGREFNCPKAQPHWTTGLVLNGW